MRQILLLTIGIFSVFLHISTTAFAQEVVVTPEPSLTPVISVSPILSLTPTPTPTPAVTPTPVELVVQGEIQDVIISEETAVLPIQIKNAPPSVAYSIKLMIKDDEVVVNKTYSTSTEEWVAWNASWSKFPVIETDSEGNGSLVIETKVFALDISCECAIIVRLRSDKGKNKDFDLGTVLVEPGEREVIDEVEDSVIDDEDEVLRQDFIVDVKEFDKSKRVQIEGVVTSSLSELGKNTVYLEDETGGIKVVFKETQGGLKHGHRISVSGTLQEAYSEYYLKVDNWQDVRVLGEESLPDPLSIQSGDVGEAVEGSVVFINGRVSATSGNTFFVNDGSGDARVYIKSTTAIQKPKMRTGYYAAITGIVSQYKDDYRVMPRFQQDVVVSTQPIDATTLGALSVLPETGLSKNTRIRHSLFLVVTGLMVRLVLAFYLRMFSRSTSGP